MFKTKKIILFCFVFTLSLFSCVTIAVNEWDEIKDSEYVEDILTFAASYGGGELRAEINKKITEMIDGEFNTDKLNFLIINYPEKADEFKDRISKLALAAAFEENTYDSLELYINEFSGYGKNTAYVNEAKAALKNMYFAAAKERNSIELYEQIILRYEKEDRAAVLEAAGAIDDIRWETAKAGGRRRDYERYIEQINKINDFGAINYNYAAKYIKEAEKSIEDFDWKDAFTLYESEDIILPLINFTELHPDSERITEAEEIIERMRKDPAYSEKYLSSEATLDTIDEFILNFPGHEDFEKALEYRKNFVGDIYSFWVEKYIALIAVGESITRSRLIVENRTNSKLIINIPYGVYFEANNSNVQNMLIREEVEFTIEPGKTRSMYLNTVCMNIFRDIPDDTNQFIIAETEKNSPLINLLKTLEKQNSSFEVAQAAVWHITDNPGKDKILNTIIYQDGTDAITEEVYNEAVRILEMSRYGR